MEPAFSIELAMEKYKTAEEVPVTCGGLTGLLLLKKFFCPAIHRACIKFNGEIVTPKQFCIMGDKQKLKDWKNAIRIDGFPLRKYIETGQLDFYRHSEFCTGRCTARTPLNRSSNISNIANEANATTVIEAVTSKALPGERVTIADTLYQRFFPSSGENDEDDSAVNKETAKQRDGGKAPQIKTEPVVPVHLTRSQSSASRLSAVKLQSSTSGLSSSALSQTVGSSSSWRQKLASAKVKSQPDKHQVFEMQDGVEIVTVSSTQLSDDQQFWLGIVEQNLCDLVFKEIHSTLDTMKQDLITYCVRGEDAYILSNVVRELGLMGKLKDKLADMKHHMDLQQASIANEMMELKKKVAEFEAKKLALKRKSDKFDYLIEVTKAKKQRKVRVVPDVAESSLLGSSSSEESEEEADVEPQSPNLAKRAAVEKEQNSHEGSSRLSEKSGKNVSKTLASASGLKKTVSSSSAKTLNSASNKAGGEPRPVRSNGTKDNSVVPAPPLKKAGTDNSAALAVDEPSLSECSKDLRSKNGFQTAGREGSLEEQTEVTETKDIQKTDKTLQGGESVGLLKVEDSASSTNRDECRGVRRESDGDAAEEGMKEEGADEGRGIVESVDQSETHISDGQSRTDHGSSDLDKCPSNGKSTHESSTEIVPEDSLNLCSPRLADNEEMPISVKAEIENSPSMDPEVCGSDKTSPSAVPASTEGTAISRSSAGEPKPATVQTSTQVNSWEPFRCTSSTSAASKLKICPSQTAVKTLTSRTPKSTKLDDPESSVLKCGDQSQLSCSARKKTPCRFCGRDRGTCIHVLPKRSKLEARKKKIKGKLMTSGKKKLFQHKAKLSAAKKKVVMTGAKIMSVTGKADKAEEFVAVTEQGDCPAGNVADKHTKKGKSDAILRVTKTALGPVKSEKAEGLRGEDLKCSKMVVDSVEQNSCGSVARIKSESEGALEDARSVGVVKTEGAEMSPSKLFTVSVSRKSPVAGSRQKTIIINKDLPDTGKSIASGYRTIVLPPQAKIPVALLQSLIKSGGSSPTKIGAAGSGGGDQGSGLSPSSSKDVTLLSKACIPGGKNTHFILGIKTSEANTVGSISNTSKMPGRVQLVAVIPPISDATTCDAKVQTPGVKVSVSGSSISKAAADQGNAVVDVKTTSLQSLQDSTLAKSSDTSGECKLKKKVEVISGSEVSAPDDTREKAGGMQQKAASLQNSKCLSAPKLPVLDSSSTEESKPISCSSKTEAVKAESKAKNENIAADGKPSGSVSDGKLVEDGGVCSVGEEINLKGDESSLNLRVAKNQDNASTAEIDRMCISIEGATSPCASPVTPTPNADDTASVSRRSVRRQPQLPAKYRDPQLLLPRKYATGNPASNVYEDIEKLNSKR